MSLPPAVARTLYKSLRTSAQNLQHQLTRCSMLIPRELDLLRQACAHPLPRELRGLLDLHNLSTTTTPIIYPSLPNYISVITRRILHAAQTPEFYGLETHLGFAALRHINARVEALAQLVYQTASDTQRFGIRVEVQSSYQGADRERFFFRYQVRINNVSQHTVQLLSRAWTIRDLDGKVTSVEGPGVVGTFPTIEPSETYEYSSAVPLSTPVGTQSGYYIFIKNGKDVTPANLQHKMLHVPIAPFSYRTPTLDVRRGGGSGAPSPTLTGLKGKGRKRRFDDFRRR